MEKVAAVKVIFGDDIRRFGLSSSSYDSLRSIVLEAFPVLKDTHNWKLKYKDEEGDLITISCDSELAEALHQPLLRINIISEGPQSQAVEKETESTTHQPAPSAELPQTQPNSPIELASIISEALSQSFSVPTQPSSQPSDLNSDASATAPSFDPTMFLPIFNQIQQNPQQSMNAASQFLSMAPQLLSDPALRNAIPGLLNALQQNPALIQALPQLLNLVANNPALLNMVPLLLNAFAPIQQQQQPQQQQQQQPCFYSPQFSSPSSAYQPQPQQQPQMQPEQQPQQEQYRPQQWTFSPSPAWKPAEFHPQPDAWPFKLFQPNTQQPQQQQQQPQQPQQPSLPTFSFTPQHGASPSFTFGHSASASPISSSSLPEFEVELQQLEAMGFTNVEANKAVLRKNNGDMVATVQDLTGAGLV